MPIITKPNTIEKNATLVFSLDKIALALNPLVVASAHFSLTSVWAKVIIKFVSETLGQYESVEFDATLSSPKGQFFVSSTAQDIFEVEKISIVDKDGAILLIPRASLNAEEFDIDFNALPSVGEPVVWDFNLQSQIFNSEGGVSGNGNPVLSSSSTTGDFKFTFVVNKGSYVPDPYNLNPIVAGVQNNLTVEPYNYGQRFTGIALSPNTRIGIYGNGNYIIDYLAFPDGDNILEIERTGNTLSVKLNSISVYTGESIFKDSEVFPVAQSNQGFEIKQAHYEPPLARTYLFSNFYKSSNLIVSNNGKSLEVSSQLPSEFGTCLISPQIHGKNNNQKYYCEFLVDNKMPNSLMSFGLVEVSQSATSITVSDLTAPKPLGLNGSSIQGSIYLKNGYFHYYNEGNIIKYVPLSFETGDSIGFLIELPNYNTGNTIFRLIKNGTELFSTSDYFGALRSQNIFIGFSPQMVGDKITLKDTPSYVMPAGTKYIQP